MIEGGEVESLGEDEDVGDEVAAASRDAVRHVVASGAGIRVGAGDAVEGLATDQWLGGIGQWAAGAFGLGAASAFLVGPVGIEEALTVGEELRKGAAKLVTVEKVASHGNFPANLAVGGKAAPGDNKCTDPEFHADSHHDSDPPSSEASTRSRDGFVALHLIGETVRFLATLAYGLGDVPNLEREFGIRNMAIIDNIENALLDRLGKQGRQEISTRHSKPPRS